MTEIDQARLEQFLGQAVGDMATAISGLLVHIGDRLGLYHAMAGPARSRRRNWPARRAPLRGTSASG